MRSRYNRRNDPRCARCFRAIDDERESPLSCNECNRKDAEKAKAEVEKLKDGGSPRADDVAFPAGVALEELEDDLQEATNRAASGDFENDDGAS